MAQTYFTVNTLLAPIKKEHPDAVVIADDANEQKFSIYSGPATEDVLENRDDYLYGYRKWHPHSSS